MEQRGKVNTTKKAGRKEEDTGGKAARVRRMQKNKSKTSEVREDLHEKLYRSRDVK